MNNEQDLAKLNDLVFEFERLDSNIPDALATKNFSFLDDVIAAKKSIKRFLAEHKSIKLNGLLSKKLRKIRDNQGYSIDSVLDALYDVTKERVSQESEEDIDYVDALFSEGTADYVDQHYFRRRNEAATIIVGQSLPPTFLNHLNKVRECYSLGLFDATIVYSRALLESGCFEYLKRRGKIESNSAYADCEYSLKDIMNAVKPYVRKKANWEAARTVIKQANERLHSKQEAVFTSESEAYYAIKTVYTVIEELFE